MHTGAKIEARRFPRVLMDVDVNIYSQRNGLAPGRTVDISEGGISAVVPIDLFIGEPMMIERGHGSALLRCFADDRLRKGAPRMVTDPDPANGRAIRAYQKAGFEKDRMVETPDGPALLMIRNP